MTSAQETGDTVRDLIDRDVRDLKAWDEAAVYVLLDCSGGDGAEDVFSLLLVGRSEVGYPGHLVLRLDVEGMHRIIERLTDGLACRALHLASGHRDHPGAVSVG